MADAGIGRDAAWEAGGEAAIEVIAADEGGTTDGVGGAGAVDRKSVV